MRFLIKLLCATIVVFLAGCATKPTIELSLDEIENAWSARAERLEAMDAWRLEGRVAVSNAQDSWSASLFWGESLLSQEVRVVAPLGQGTAVVRREANGLAELHLSNGQVYFGEDASELLHQQLGWYLPVESLAYWVKGLPDPRFASTWQLDGQGKLSELVQSGWRIEYKGYRYSDFFKNELPAKLALVRDDWRVKLVVQDWQSFERGRDE